MGSVRIDIHDDEYEWKNVTLTDINTIRGLIKYRYQYDTLIYEDAKAGGMNEELICLYADLDRMIERCSFTKRQKEVLDLYMVGYNERDISEVLNIRPDVVEGIIHSICKKIKHENDLAWKYDFIYWNKVKTPDKWKQCSKCKKYLPATEEFFGKHPNTNNGLQSICKKCNLSYKK